jgi:hypothetical protein
MPSHSAHRLLVSLADHGVGLAVLEVDVVPGLPLLDQVVLEDEGSVEVMMTSTSAMFASRKRV